MSQKDNFTDEIHAGINTTPSFSSRWEIEIAKKYLDAAGVLIVVLNRGGEITFINKRGCEILGKSEEWIIGKNWFDHFLPQENCREVKRVFEKLMGSESELVEYYKNPIIAKDGEKRYFAWYNTTIKNDLHATIGVLSSGEDITEQKKAENALKESEARYKTLVQTSPDAVIVTNKDGIITYVSLQTLKLFEYTQPEAMIGKNIMSLMIPEHRAKLLLNMKKSMKEGCVQAVEYTFPQQNGRRFIGEMNMSVIIDENDIPKMFIATVRNCSERKKAEKDLLKSIQEKEILLQEIHHRVKNNLQVISSLLDLSSMRIEDAKANNLISDAQTKIQTMAFIHNQLYNSERFDNVDMGAHVRDLLRYLKSFYAQNKNISISVRIHDIFLSITKAIPCALVINELVSNAFKHAFKEKENGVLEIAMTSKWDNKISMNIRNDGAVWDEDFDLFSTESLGLKLVRNLVRNQLKGKIELKRKEYTEFHIEFKKK